MHWNFFPSCDPPESEKQLHIDTTPLGIVNYTQHVPALSTASASTSLTSVQSPAAQFLAQFLSTPVATTTHSNNPECTARVIGGDYELDKVIGYGGFATVWQAFRISTGEKVAIKMFSNNTDDCERLESELEIWRSLDHPHLLRMHTALEDDTGIHVICDYCPLVLVDSLMEKKRFAESEAAKIFGELCLAVSYLHQRNICHRDIKLDNVLLDKSGKVKLADFGLATWLAMTNKTTEGTVADAIISKTDCSSSSSSNSCGSIQYAPPDAEPLSLKTDMWSMGVLLFALVAGRLPFEDDYLPRLRKHIAEGRYEMPPEFSPSLQDLIQGLLCVNIERRFCIRRTLQSAWLSSF